MRSALPLVFISITACGLGRTDVLYGRDASVTTVRDASATSHDAGSTPVDAGFPDSGVDLSLGEVLSCHLDRDQALEAAVRFTACTEFRASVATIVEAWEGFVLGSGETFASMFSNVPHGCTIWECAARADSCRDLFDCVEAAGTATRRCGEGEVICLDDVANICLGDDLWVPHQDCAVLQATCGDRGCEIDECRLAPATCDDQGRIVGCDGLVALDCEAWRPGSRCAPFYIGGEFPVVWCAPNGEGQAGAYDRPVDCDGRTISFDSVSGDRYAYDCRSNGYAGCDERGCR